MFNLLLDPINVFYYVLGGVIYGINVFCWYQIIKYLNVSIATIIITPQVIFTALFASLLLEEAFTVYHLIGLIIILISIVVINLKRNKPKSK
jgi:drug/metabolite transporter (DMT)-like permease